MSSIKISVLSTEDRRWGRKGKQNPVPTTVLIGTKFRHEIEPGFPGTDITGAWPDEGTLRCIEGHHKGQTVDLVVGDDLLIEIYDG